MQIRMLILKKLKYKHMKNYLINSKKLLDVLKLRFLTFIKEKVQISEPSMATIRILINMYLTLREKKSFIS